MRALFLTNYPSPYRVEFFNQLGVHVDLTVSFTSTPKEQKHRDKSWFIDSYEHFTPIFLNSQKICGKDIAFDILNLVKERWDIIIFGGYSELSFMLAMEYLRFRRIPFYIEFDGGLIKNDNKIKYWIKKHFISRAKGWFSSGEITNKYLLYYGADFKRIFNYPFSSLINNDFNNSLLHLNCNDYVVERERIRLKAKMTLSISEKKVIISVGQCIHRKGFDLLIKASKAIKEETDIYIIGGEITEEYEKLISEHKVQNVHFVGFKTKDELSIYYNAADLFVMPTREDVWGLVINEAMSCGLPVVTTDRCVAGMELVEEGKNGFIVQTGDVKALADGINNALSSNLDIMGYESYQKIQGYTIEKMVSRHLEILSNITNSKDSVRRSLSEK